MKPTKTSQKSNKSHIRYIDLFCGIGGFRFAMNSASEIIKIESQCVFSSDIDSNAQTAYEANFGELPFGDITQVTAEDVPDHELLLGGFPCQAFSIIGDMKGFSDTRGTLFFDIARIIEAKNPPAFVLENVKQLRGHDSGRTLSTILKTLDQLGYWVDYRVLNALDYGLPQKRERILIVGFKKGTQRNFSWPPKISGVTPSLDDFLESDHLVDEKYFASERIQIARKVAVFGKALPPGRSIWHENKSGNVSPLPYSCALRAGASYNYLLVDGVRRLTPREMLNLQGFPKDFKIAVSASETRKQAGNSVPVPMIAAVIQQVLRVMKENNLGLPQPNALADSSHHHTLPLNFEV
jgi:DNA (cytosine-5)-methyltransferase 1